tara:strand:+ start:325 stop:771 length:447 start_codon:yes stop_codon:yes gene_type:complete
MNLKINMNFSFRNLAKKINSISGQYVDDLAKESAGLSKDKITKGLERLKKSTIDIRKMRGIAGTKPLIATGALFRSIKSAKGGFKMLHYGLNQHKGFTTGKKSMIPNKKVPARPFIVTSGAIKPFNQFRKRFSRSLRATTAQRLKYIR